MKIRTPKTWGPFVSVTVALVLVALIGWGLALQTIKKDNDTSASGFESGSTSTSTTSIDEDRQSALVAAETILETAAKIPDGSSSDMMARLEALSRDDTSVIDPTLPSLIDLDDSETLPASENNIYQGLITLSSYLLKSGEATPLTTTSWKNVHINSDKGIAYVPLSIFEESAPFSLQFVKTDDGWKLEPYSFLNEIKIAAGLASSSESGADE